MTWKQTYKALIALRNWLNGLIGYVRAKAYPESKGKRRRVTETENQPTVSQ